MLICVAVTRFVSIFRSKLNSVLGQNVNTFSANSGNGFQVAGTDVHVESEYFLTRYLGVRLLFLHRSTASSSGKGR